MCSLVSGSHIFQWSSQNTNQHVKHTHVKHACSAYTATAGILGKVKSTNVSVGCRLIWSSQDPNPVFWPASFHLVRAPICSSAHKANAQRCKGCTRKLLYHFGNAEVNVEGLMATGKKWQVSSFQSLLSSPQLLLKPTLPLQRTLLCIRTTTNSPSTGEPCNLKYRTALRKPIHRIAFRRCNIRAHMPFASVFRHCRRRLRFAKIYITATLRSYIGSYKSRVSDSMKRQVVGEIYSKPKTAKSQVKSVFSPAKSQLLPE